MTKETTGVNTSSAAEERKAELEAKLLQLDLEERQEEVELKKLQLAAKKAQAKTDRARAIANLKETRRNAQTLQLQHERYLRSKRLEEGIENFRVYDFVEEVDDETVYALIDALRNWEIADDVDGVKRDILIKFNSPGGSVLDGFDAYDHIINMRERGWKIDTFASGIAASMAGILMQAGEERLIGRNATLHMHEIGSMNYGKTSEHKDALKFTEALEAKGAAIYASRSDFSVQDILDMWERKEVYLSAEEAVAHKLVDRIV